MKGFGYDGAAHSSPHQSVTPKLVVWLSQGELQSVCSHIIGDCWHLSSCVCVCVCVFAACIHATLLSGKASV